jgi:hypothetical protein
LLTLLEEGEVDQCESIQIIVDREHGQDPLENVAVLVEVHGYIFRVNEWENMLNLNSKVSVAFQMRELVSITRWNEHTILLFD